MKKIGEYTLKGQIPASSDQRITLFDGRFDTGYRIESFQVGPTTDPSANDVFAKLSTIEGESGIAWDWSSNTQVAWSAYGATGASPNGVFTQIDPDNLIVEDLYISNGAAAANYIITMTKYDISDWQGALAMVRNKSQG